MSTFSQPSPHPVFDELHTSLDYVTTVLNEKWADTPLSVSSLNSGSTTASQRTFLLETADGVSTKVRISAFPFGENTYEVYVDIADGPTRRFTHSLPENSVSGLPPSSQLGRSVSSFLLQEIEPQFDPSPTENLPAVNSTPSIPHIHLDREGKIEDLNAPARRALGYSEKDLPEHNFFSFVHRRNMRQVMRDLAQMVNHGMTRARWLLRLRSGGERWTWYRATVRNRLRTDGTILITLQPFGRARWNR